MRFRRIMSWRAVAMMLAFVMLPWASVHAQQANQEGLGSLLAQLNFSNWIERANAVAMLRDSSPLLSQPGVVHALLDLKERENRIVDDSYRRGVGVSNEYGEEYSECYAVLGNILYDLADFRDERTLRIMAFGAYNPDSRLAQKLVRVGGERIVPIASEMASGEIDAKRWNGLALLEAFLLGNSLSGSASGVAEEAKRAILEATNHPDSMTRRNAVLALVNVGTSEDIPLLERMAANDPDSRVQRGKGRIYPVREAAAKAIESIRQRSVRK